MRYWIMDQDETPQRFPLQRLLRRVREVAGGERVTCDILKVRGYGPLIHEWEEELDSRDRIVVPIELLDRLSEGTGEWFYDLEALFPDDDILFGLHDSTALFVEARADIADGVASGFTLVRSAQESR